MFDSKNNYTFAPMKNTGTYITIISRIITPTTSPEVRML